MTKRKKTDIQKEKRRQTYLKKKKQTEKLRAES